MQVGRIKKLNCERGYGFIANAEGPDVFFHHSAVAEGELRPLRDSLTGTRVTYDVENSDRGLRAINVRPA
jgi:CspA family cold shock protein